MASNFNRRRLALLKEREAAISKVVPDQTQAVEKTSLIAAPASSGDATPSADTSDEAHVPPPNKDDKGKGKSSVPSGSKGKQVHEGIEVEGSNKKKAHSSGLSTVDESEETMALTVSTSELSRLPREFSKNLPDYPWTREGFKLPKSRNELLKLSQEIQKATPPLTNLMLFDSWIGKFFGGAVLSRGMDSDTYAHARSHSIGVEETVEQIGAFLSQVSNFGISDFLDCVVSPSFLTSFSC